ncbi:hypothetical protein, partial [Staphylococcus epidermidis]
LLSSNSNIFNISNDLSASSIVQDQDEWFEGNLSAMEQILEDYQSQRDNVDIEDYINHLKQVDNQLDKQADAKDQSK